MAYVSHSPYRWSNEFRARSASANAALIAKSALVAIAAGAVIVGLSGAAREAEPQTVSTAKGDRIAAPVSRIATAEGASASVGSEVVRDSKGQVVYVNDPKAHTTTVVRGATIPLSPQSPLAGSTE